MAMVAPFVGVHYYVSRDSLCSHDDRDMTTLCVYICVCIYICIHTHIYIHIYIYAHIRYDHMDHDMLGHMSSHSDEHPGGQVLGCHQPGTVC
jgi:hypothetical protein